jgi:hypothetical protein
MVAYQSHCLFGAFLCAVATVADINATVGPEECQRPIRIRMLPQRSPHAHASRCSMRQPFDSFDLPLVQAFRQHVTKLKLFAVDRKKWVLGNQEVYAVSVCNATQSQKGELLRHRC